MISFGFNADLGTLGFWEGECKNSISSELVFRLGLCAGFSWAAVTVECWWWHIPQHTSVSLDAHHLNALLDLESRAGWATAKHSVSPECMLYFFCPGGLQSLEPKFCLLVIPSK
jgi:hypothetical protein